MADFRRRRILPVFVICASLTATGPLGAEVYTYDDLGRLVSATLDDGTVITYRYDPAGNRTAVVIAGAPSAVDDVGVRVELDTPTPIDVLANDTDPNNDGLLITSVTQPTDGTASIIDVSGEDWVQYTPNAGYLGPDAFTYTITDGQSSASADVSVSVVANNDPPVAVNDVTSTNEDQQVTINPLSNDSDPENQPLSLGTVSAPSHGTAVKSGNSVIYTPDPDYFGPDSFSYNVSDGELTSSAVVSVTVNPVNDPPVANDDAILTSEDMPITFNPRTNDSDVETLNSALIITAASGMSKGSVDILNGGTQLRYTPNANANGADSFTYTIRDGDSATASATVNVSITPVDDDIIAVNDSISTNEDMVAIFDPRVNDIEPDGQNVVITAAANGSHGTSLVIDNGTRIRYTPQPDFSGSDSFSYTVSDGHSSDTATVSMTINPVNDPPSTIVQNLTVTRNQVRILTTGATDPEGDAFTITAASSGVGAQAEPINNGTAIRYLCGCSLTNDWVTYTVTDVHGASNTGTINITINNPGGGGNPLLLLNGGGPQLEETTPDSPETKSE